MSNVIFLQETMCSGNKVEEALKHLLRHRSFCLMDYVGLLGGLLVAQGTFFRVVSSSIVPSRIVVEIKDRSLNSVFELINIYGPYSDCIPFGEGLSSSGVLEAKNVILVGDLNFTLSTQEIWGEHARKNA
jgi:hypothetical protein